MLASMALRTRRGPQDAKRTNLVQHEISVVAERSTKMLILLALLVVLLFAGLGFAVHFLWILAAIFFVIWLVGFALGRGESAANTTSTGGESCYSGRGPLRQGAACDNH